MTVAAFFDVDGTLYRDSLMVEHFKKLIKYEVLDAAVWHGDAKRKFENWVKRHGDYEDYLLEIADIYINNMKGLERDYIRFITDQVVKLKGERVYRYTRDRIIWHQEQGHMVVFISGSPEYLVERMAEKYQVEHFVGTRYYVDENNRFTGEIDPMWDSESKNRFLEGFIKKQDISLEESYAYGDTTGDHQMLQMVGHPVLINPIKKLVEAIQADPLLKEKASIIVERKDVIYQIPADVSIL